VGFKLLRVNVRKLEANEQRELKLVLEPEDRAVIHGIVKFPDGRPVEGAVVKLFHQPTRDPCKLVPVTFAFTDKCGQFLFGVPSGRNFVIKVFLLEDEVPDPPDC